MRTPVGRAVVRALQPAGPSRRSVLAGAAAGVVVSSCAPVGPAGPPIPVFGGGLAGLSAALHLQDLGAGVQVFEGGSRLGGRVLSTPDAAADGMVRELGGAFINADHLDLIALARRFGLAMTDLRHMDRSGAPESAFYFFGALQSQAAIAAALSPLAARIARDIARVEDGGWTAEQALDAMSVRDYLDAGEPLDPLAVALVAATIRGEFGVEMEQSSALQLLDMGVYGGASADEGAEVFTIAGGASRLTQAIAAALKTPPRLNARLAWVRGSGDNGYDFILAGGEVIAAQRAVIALPPPAFARVRMDAALSPALQRGLAALHLGAVEKAVFSFQGKPWRTPAGFSREAFGDWGFAAAWESDHGAGSQSVALSFLLGGQAMADNAALLDGLDRFAPVSAMWTGEAVRSAWGGEALIGGGYLNLRPGQRTDPNRPRWEESQTDHAVRAVGHQGLAFAGEHLSEDFYGYMNGAAQTGRLAARWLLQAGG